VKRRLVYSSSPRNFFLFTIEVPQQEVDVGSVPGHRSSPLTIGNPPLSNFFFAALFCSSLGHFPSLCDPCVPVQKKSILAKPVQTPYSTAPRCSSLTPSRSRVSLSLQGLDSPFFRPPTPLSPRENPPESFELYNPPPPFGPHTIVSWR